MSRLTVLHAGPLDSVHVARWAEMSRALGHRTVVAGHLRPGLAQAPMGSPVHRAPQLRWASTRYAQTTGRPRHRVTAALPNAVVEARLWARWLVRLAKTVRPDVVHAHWLPQWPAAAALARVAPTVAGPMGSDVYLVRGVQRRLARLALRRADAVLAPSPHAARLLGEPHLEPGVSLDRFRPPSPEERAAARARLGLGDGPVVLSFRAPGPLYNLPTAIAAFRRLRVREPRAQLLVAHGPMTPPPDVRAALAGLDGSARVLGAVPHDEMAGCFHAADVGVSIPSSDASPASVWESLACGLPVVASDLPQLRERVGPDRGVTFTKVEPEAVADAALGLLRSRGLALAGRAWVEANLDRRDALSRLDAAYRELAA